MASHLSPGGDLIAYYVAGPNGGAIWVTDLAGGGPSGSPGERSWRCNGARKATVCSCSGWPRRARRLWSRLVWDGSETAEFPGLHPNAGLPQRVPPFWEQYSRGMTLWSPAGDAFAYPAAGADGDQILVQRVDATEPAVAGPGTVVAWSP